MVMNNTNTMASGKSKFHLRFTGNQAVQTFQNQPILDEIRRKSREVGNPLEQADILQSDFYCSMCETSIDERFSAATNGSILCFSCASEGSVNEDGLRKTTDPAKVIIGESGLNHKSLCDYVINVATGCSHGCKFCYVPSTPNITARQEMLNEKANVENGQKEWGNYLLYRDDLPERLHQKLDRKRKWKQTPRGRGVVMLSSGTDCYQDRRAAQITRGCVIELIKREIPVRILTRSPAVTRDIDLFREADELSKDKSGSLIRIGSSIPCLDDKQTRAIEPRAPVPTSRYNALKQLSEFDIPIYVSMSPTYPTMTEEDFDRHMEKFAKLEPEVLFHEPINPRGGNFDMTIEAARNAGESELSAQLEKLKEHKNWIEYSLTHMEWAREYGRKHGIDVHVWPDKGVINSVDESVASRLREQRDAVSPEQIPAIPLPG